MKAPDATLMTEYWLSMDVDAWTRHVIHRTFNPDLGSPYWLRRAKDLDFNPLDITQYSELTAFGPFDGDVLRTVEPADMVPLSTPRPLSGRIWETGGTTGSPWRVYFTEPMMLHKEIWRWYSFIQDGFEPYRTWLVATPSGPHAIGNMANRELPDMFGATVYSIDMDSRWVKRLIRNSRLNEVSDYTQHLLDQITDVCTRDVDYLYTTPALLQALISGHPDLVARLRGVRLSGTQVTATMYREFVRALRGGVVGLTYGNTLGLGHGLPVRDNGDVMPYAPTYPQLTMSVVDTSDNITPVPYGEVGRVRLTVLHEDLFIPNVLERDQAIRLDLSGQWPCDGVGNVSPLVVTSTMPEGLY